MRGEALPLLNSNLRRTPAAVAAILSLCLLCDRSALSQTTPVSRLAPPNARLSEDFVGIATGRELADGRLLTGEGTHDSRRLILVDFARGTTQQIGRRGNGPGEYQIVPRLFALTNDSTLFEADQRRWLLLAGNKIVRTLVNDSSMRIASTAQGVDTLGNVLSFARTSNRPDSSGMILVSRTTGKPTLVARLRSTTETGYPPPPIRQARGRVDYFNGPWNGYELSWLFPDGWLAVARVQPYRVDWRTPDGRWILGKPLPSPIVRVSEREKAAYMQRAAERSGTSLRSPAVYPKWPTEIPPFLPGALIGSNDGRLLVLRTPTADHPEVRYDIIDRQGRLERQLLLDGNQRIVAFGKASVYVVVTDENDLERIQRHPWLR